MSQVSAVLRRAENGYSHWCPGCKKMHVIRGCCRGGGELSCGGAPKLAARRDCRGKRPAPGPQLSPSPAGTPRGPSDRDAEAWRHTSRPCGQRCGKLRRRFACGTRA